MVEPPRPRLRLVGLALGAALVLTVGAAGCSSSTTHTTGGTIASTVVAGPSTSAPPVPPKVPIAIPTASDGTSPDGSGCDPSTDTLPTGIWYGILKTVTPATPTAPGTVGLDLACWFSGKSAQAITGGNGAPDDVYVRNQNPRVYTIPTIAGVAVVPLARTAAGGLTGALGRPTNGLAAAQTMLTDGSDHGVWVLINQDVATVIQAQFHP